jgi:lipopolysaccharide export system permease protein
MFFLNTTVVPWSVETSRAMLDSFALLQQARTHSSSNTEINRVVTFDNQRQRRLWFFNSYNRHIDRAYGVTVSELDTRRHEKTRIMAREARYDREKRGWTFSDGREEWFDPETGDLTRTVPFIEKIVPYFSENPDLMLAFDLKPNDLSFFQLRTIIDYFTVEENPKVTIYAVRYFGLLSDTLAPLIVIALAIPFAVSGVRVNPAVGVSKSIGLFLIYFILLKAANAMGDRGAIDPLTAAWVPNVAMLGIGGWFFLRLR